MPGAKRSLEKADECFTMQTEDAGSHDAFPLPREEKDSGHHDDFGKRLTSGWQGLRAAVCLTAPQGGSLSGFLTCQALCGTDLDIPDYPLRVLYCSRGQLIYNNM